MTTIAVARLDGRVAIAADTRVKHGYTNVSSSKYLLDESKILRVGANVFAITGGANWGLVLESYFNSLVELPALDSRLAIFAALGDLHDSLKARYQFAAPADEEEGFEKTNLSVLLANPSGIYGISPMRDVSVYARFFALGCGYRYALGAMHAVYDGADSPTAVVRAGIAASAEFDEDTGLPIEVHEIGLDPLWDGRSASPEPPLCALGETQDQLAGRAG